MWTQPVDPLHNLALSSLVAALPILFLAVLLLSRRVSGYVASICTLLLAMALVIIVYGMPVPLAGLSALYGMASGLLPIGWIVLNAVFLYNLSVASGSFAVVRDSIEAVTADRRLQALLIAFCFGAFLEGAAGFGAPVAITAGMLVGLGFDSLYAASICLLANTAPVAFGGIGIAVITAGHLTGIDPDVLSRMIGHQLPAIALIIPAWLVVIIAGWRGLRAVWPAVLVAGTSYAITMYLTASYLGPTLPDILSSLVSLVCLVTLLRYWQPRTTWRFPHESRAAKPIRQFKHSRRDLLRAWTPFVLLVIFIGNWAANDVQQVLSQFTVHLPFGFLDRAVSSNGHALSVVYAFPWLAAAGTGILLAALTSAVLLGLSRQTVWDTARHTITELRSPLITIAAIVGFAYVANYSGMSGTLAAALSHTGWLFPLLAPLLGWLGVFITGSDTSSNALFSGVQLHTAESLGINPVLTVAANTSGGVAAKMISPQSIAVAAAATNLVGQEGTLFRRTVGHSLGIVAIICIITWLQAYVVPGMVPAPVAIGAVPSHVPGLASLALVLGSISAVGVLAWINRRPNRPDQPHTSRAGKR